MARWHVFLNSLQNDAERYGRYPDGTLLFEGGDSFHRLWNAITASRLQENGVPTPNLLEHGIWQPHGFGGLEEFRKGTTSYMLFYTRDYRESLGALDFSVVFPAIVSDPTRDYDLKNLQISVGFKRKVSQKTRRLFLESLKKYFDSVSKAGMFNEGPLRLASPEIAFRDRLAQFRIDASSSGQDTLNWLLITVLNFGYSTSLVEQFVFDHDKNLERFTGPIVGEVQIFSLDGLTSRAGQ